MYRDKVLLDDAVAVILLMECTAAASSGRIFGGGGVNYSSDSNENRNPEYKVGDKVLIVFKKYEQRKKAKISFTRFITFYSID
jgi:hypothetical protein